MGQNFGLKEKFITQIFFEFFAIKFDGNVWSLIVALWDGHVKSNEICQVWFFVFCGVGFLWWSPKCTRLIASVGFFQYQAFVYSDRPLKGSSLGGLDYVVYPRHLR